MDGQTAYRCAIWCGIRYARGNTSRCGKHQERGDRQEEKGLGRQGWAAIEETEEDVGCER